MSRSTQRGHALLRYVVTRGVLSVVHREQVKQVLTGLIAQVHASSEPPISRADLAPISPDLELAA